MTWEWASLIIAIVAIIAGTGVRIFGNGKPSAASFATLNFRVQQLEKTVEKMDKEMDAGFVSLSKEVKQQVQRLYDKLDGKK